MAHITVTQELLSAMHEIRSEFLYLPTMQCSCCCSPSVRDNQPSGMRDTCVHFIRHLATQEYRSEPASLQNIEEM